MKIAIGSDHAGYLLKEAIKRHLAKGDIPFSDIGTFKMDSVNYPEFSYKVSVSVANGDYDFGILICGTGIGMCITANKIKGIRAAQAYTTEQAKLSRLHNDANILCLGGRMVNEEEAIVIVDTWLNTSFEGGRHVTRLKLISQLTGL
ncbi:MAG: ribose 5-phosphate isomerase B [Candidatus Atribacteria bacterium]|nr:ribose 5-phosphate isomerase B [Candidatus Atribacteria bacterium]